MKALKLLAACGLLVLLGCQNPMQRPPATDGTGTLLLSIGGTNARTILPDFDFEIGDFDRFVLAFANAANDETRIEEELFPTDGVFPGVDLPVGSWSLTVTAFYDGEAVARGSTSVTIVAEQPSRAGVTLMPIARGEDRGTFSWEIDFSDIEGATSLVLRVFEWPLESGADPILVPNSTFNDIPVGTNNWLGRVDLPPGQYYVIFTLRRDDESATVSAILHVAANLTSSFDGVDATFTRRDLSYSGDYGQLFDVVMGAWSSVDGVGEWDFAGAGIRYGHFALLGIHGVTSLNFHDYDATGVIWWLNSFNEAPINLAELQDLFAEALELIAAEATLAQHLSNLRRRAQSGGTYPIDISIFDDIIRLESYETSLNFEGRTNITVILEACDTRRTIQLEYFGILFEIPSGVTLVLGNNVTLQGPGENSAALVVVRPGGTLIMDADSAEIINNINVHNPVPDGPWNRHGGGVRVEGTFRMNAGRIYGNMASHTGGAGVFIANGGEFHMEDGTITGNTAHSWGGGGVFVDRGGKFNMSEGVIRENVSTYGGGGGVHVGAFTDGDDPENNYGTFVMSGGLIELNRARNGGGGVFVNAHTAPNARGQFTMSGGTISDNFIVENADGGGVFVSGDFRMEGTAVIYGNRANNGGGVSIGMNEYAPWGGIFHMAGGTISGNNATGGTYGTAWGSGAGVHIGGDGTFIMTYGTISENAADDRGGGVFVAGSFDMAGGTVYGNNTAPAGASLYVDVDGTARFGTYTEADGFIPEDYFETTDNPIRVQGGLQQL